MAGVVLGPPGLGLLNPVPGARLAVWGDPIAHSRSPQLHAAAYEVLGLDWTYGRQRVDATTFASTLAVLDDSWRGLSLTFPLKAAAFAAATGRDRRAALTGAVNTLLLEADGPLGFNTDVGGIVRVLREEGLDGVDRARIVGAGATATSALVALDELGAQDVEIVARRPEAAAALLALGETLGITVTASPLPGIGGSAPDERGAERAAVPLTIATLPGGTALADSAAHALAESGGVLLDVVYGTWPTPLANVWEAHGSTAHSGLGMLLHQAVLQVRIFVAGDAESALPDEDLVLAAMRRAVVGD